AILNQDETIGAAIEALRAHGRLERTVILSTSDHGEAFGEHGVSGHRRMFFEEIVHVPCWAYLPEPLAQRYGAVLRGHRTANVANLDWVPTVVDLLELQRVPEVAELMGQVSGQSLLRAPDPERVILVQNGTNDQRLSDGYALIQGPYRLLDHPQ